jgi:hypothetical protein
LNRAERVFSAPVVSLFIGVMLLGLACQFRDGTSKPQAREVFRQGISINFGEYWSLRADVDDAFALTGKGDLKLDVLPIKDSGESDELYAEAAKLLETHRSLVSKKGNPAVSQNGTKLHFREFDSPFGHGYIMVSVPPESFVATKRTVGGNILGRYLVGVLGHFEPGDDEGNIERIVNVLRTLSE